MQNLLKNIIHSFKKTDSMFVKQSKNSFIRTTENYGYIKNQLTRHDRTYDSFGADLLREISREPKSVDDVVEHLLTIYKGVDFATLKADFMEFAQSLARDKFIMLGDTPEELDANDMTFSYSMDNPKTLASDFYQETETPISENTQDFFLEEVQGRPLISNIQFELSSRCNERCIHCYIPNEKKNAGFDMPTSKVKNLIDQLADMGGLHVTFSGGEAFLHKDLIELVRYAREKDMMVTILSNLIALRDEQVEQLRELNVSLIQVSLYSMEPQIHDLITTVKGSFIKSKAAIEKLVAADVPVQISCPIMKANRKGYKDVLHYARSLKIKAQTDFIMMAQADFNTNNLANRISIEETEELLRDIMDYDLQYRDKTLKQRPISEEIKFDIERYKKQPLCGVGYDNCCITANGDVYPCAGWQSMVLGNVNEQPLVEIWEKSERLKELRKITQADFPECLDCEARDFCARCLVRNYNESGGDMYKINKHFCDVAFLTKRLVIEKFGVDFNKKDDETC
ncbi:MAG: radical SAM protein [Bacteroidales bacterium]|nr:radical SAM protein [Bacteroidales bacterium]